MTAKACSDQADKVTKDEDDALEDNHESVDMYRIRRRCLKPKAAREQQLQHITRQLNRIHMLNAFGLENGLTMGEILFLLNGYDLDIARHHLRAHDRPTSNVDMPLLGRELNPGETLAPRWYHQVRYACGCIEGYDISEKKKCGRHNKEITHVSNYKGLRTVEGWMSIEEAHERCHERFKKRNSG